MIRAQAAATGFYRNGHRDYDPPIGGYLEPDPLGLRAGLNPWPYAGSNPFKNIDPTGLDTTLILYRGAGGAGHIGLGVAPHGQTVAPGQTVGFYPAPGYSTEGGLLGTPGVLEQDIGKIPMTSVPSTITIPTTPEQDAQVLNYLNNLSSSGNYSLLSAGHAQNCATVAEGALRAEGIDAPETIVPLLLMHDLQRTYGGHN